MHLPSLPRPASQLLDPCMAGVDLANPRNRGFGGWQRPPGARRRQCTTAKGLLSLPGRVGRGVRPPCGARRRGHPIRESRRKRGASTSAGGDGSTGSNKRKRRRRRRTISVVILALNDEEKPGNEAAGGHFLHRAMPPPPPHPTKYLNPTPLPLHCPPCCLKTSTTSLAAAVPFHLRSPHVTQGNMFKVAGVPMVKNCIAGYNSCMFAYSQVSYRSSAWHAKPSRRGSVRRRLQDEPQIHAAPLDGRYGGGTQGRRRGKGLALRVDVPRDTNIRAQAMESLNIPKGICRVLFRTRNIARKLLWTKHSTSTVLSG